MKYFMKVQALVPMLLWGVSVSAQKKLDITIPYDSTSNRFTYAGIVEIDSLPSSVMYSNARAWLIGLNVDTSFVDAVTDMKLVDNGVVPIHMPIKNMPGIWNTFYTLTLEFKEGRYRYTIDRFLIWGDGTASAVGSTPLETFVKLHESMKVTKKAMINQEEQFCAILDVEMKKLIESMKSGVEAPKKTSDW